MPKIAYTDEFKRDAVALVASGIPQKQVATRAVSRERQQPILGIRSRACND